MSDIKEPEVIDAMPNEWKSDREKPHEPLFGPGLPWFIGILITVCLVAYAHEAGYGPIGKGSAALVGAVIGGVINQFRG